MMTDTFELPADPNTTDVAAVLAKLPPLCASNHPKTGEPILLRRGVLGFFGAIGSDWLDVEQFNRERGITEFQRQAMEIGSMFGWDAPGADPDRWRARAERAAA